MKDSILNNVNDVTVVVGDKMLDFNIWQYIAIAELVVMIILLLVIVKIKGKTKKHVEINVSKVLTEQPDTQYNILNIGKKLNGDTQILYDKLRKACHPDRFPNDVDKIAIATELISRVNQSKDKFSDLALLKIEIEKQLNLKIH